jgi:hypothetical protein
MYQFKNPQWCRKKVGNSDGTDGQNVIFLSRPFPYSERSFLTNSFWSCFWLHPATEFDIYHFKKAIKNSTMGSKKSWKFGWDTLYIKTSI